MIVKGDVLVLRKRTLNHLEVNVQNVSVCVLVTQSSMTLCDLKDCGPSGCSLHGILQARILERVAIPLSRGSS